MNRSMPVLLLTLSVVSLASTETATAAGQGPGAGRWQHEAPEAHGLDSAMLKAAGDAVGAIGGRQGLVVVRDGVIVYEDYWSNAYHQATPDWRNTSFSSAKSFASALVGVAVTEGLLNIDDLVSTYHSAEASGLRPGTTIKHLLTMSSGGTLIIKPSSRRPNPKTDNPRRGAGIDYMRVIKPEAGTPPGYGSTLAPGETFFYDSKPMDHLANVLAAAAGKSARQYAVEHLLTPLGVENFNYQPEGVDSDDNPRMGGSVELSVRDLARLGQLWLNGGRWDGTQLVDRAYVEQAVAPSATNPGYGFLWWLNTTGVRGPTAPRNMYFALGGWGQIAYVLPDLQIVIATMGFTLDRPPGIYQAIWEALAPALPLEH